MKQLKFLFVLALFVGVVPGTKVTISAQVNWDSDLTLSEDVNNDVSVMNSITLTVNSTRTINGTITIPSGKTLTITGSGTLTVNGSEGDIYDGTNGQTAIHGDVIIDDATVIANGGNGVEGQIDIPGTIGGIGIYGNVTINSGSLTVKGGTGGEGGAGMSGGASGEPGSDGSDGGDGGDGISGTVKIYGGCLVVNGGKGGNGGEGGAGAEGQWMEEYDEETNEIIGSWQEPGGDGGDGGDGGNGGNGITGTLGIYGGTSDISYGEGGNGGYGGVGGNDAMDGNMGEYGAYGSSTTSTQLFRTLQTGGWNTFCAPFAMSSTEITSVLGEGASVKSLSSSSYNAGTGALSLTFANASSIEAGKPYLVKVPATVSSLTVSNATVSSGTTTVETDYVDFVPVMSPVALTANDKSVLFIKGGNTLTYPNSDSSINAFRAYFQLKGDAAASARNFSMEMDGETTAINDELRMRSEEWAGAQWYTLDGRKLNDMPTEKGLYIVNGKKVVIK